MSLSNTSTADQQFSDGKASINTHPSYQEYAPDWEQMRETYKGSRTIKAAGTTRLPKTGGQESDGTLGTKAYESYKMRAVFYDLVADTVQDMLGLLHKEPTTYELPDRLEDLKTSATEDNETLNILLRRIHEQQLIPSRIGLLLDPPTATVTNPIPQIVQYNAECILNWDDEHKEPRWIILDESKAVVDPTNFSWEQQTRYRLLALDGKDVYYTAIYDTFPKVADMDNPTVAEDPLDPQFGEAIYPTISGNTIGLIPFVCINATSITLEVEKPMLLGLSNLALAVYRGDADYRQALFFQGQDTLFLKGFGDDETSAVRVGAGAYISSKNSEAEASFIGFESDGLTEMKESQQDLLTAAHNMGVELMEKSSVESGDALLTRLTVRTASLTTIARVASAGLQKLLRMASEWMNATGDIIITPALDFTDSGTTTKEVLDMWAVVQQGGMSMEDYHAWLAQNDYTAENFDDWSERIANNPALGLGLEV